MNCDNNKCLCQSMCLLIGNCILRHELFADSKISIKGHIAQAPANKREKKIIELLQCKQPPKVSGAQIDRYFSLIRRGGLDLDKDRVTKRERLFHAKFKRTDSRKMRNRIKIKKDAHRPLGSRKQVTKDYMDKYHPQKPPSRDIIAKWMAEPEPDFHEKE